MSNTAKIYILALISFLVGTSQYIISGILDKMADALGVSIGAAGQCSQYIINILVGSINQ